MPSLRTVPARLAPCLWPLALSACLVGEELPADPEPELEVMEATTKRQIQYVVISHPDDEVGSWSMIQRSTDNYPVFVLLTRGEETGHCADPSGGYEPTLAGGQPSGELAPSPWPTGRWTNSCTRARLGSWHRFLDAQADIDSTLDRRAEMVAHGQLRAAIEPGDPTPIRVDQGASRTTDYYDLWVGPRSARMVFDLGDGDLTTDEVVWAVRTARRTRLALFPLTSEYGAIGASFYNASYPDCFRYEHRDHRAVHVALWNTDLGLRAQWGRTCASDPDANRTDEIDRDVYDYTFGVEADGYRSGSFQQHYGWLWEEAWARGDLDVVGPTSRRQSHWRRSWR